MQPASSQAPPGWTRVSLHCDVVSLALAGGGYHVRGHSRDCHTARGVRRYPGSRCWVSARRPSSSGWAGWSLWCPTPTTWFTTPLYDPQPRHVRRPSPHPGRSSLGLRSSARAFQPTFKPSASSSCAPNPALSHLESSAISHTSLVHSPATGCWSSTEMDSTGRRKRRRRRTPRRT